jgi:hypothetical protein
MKMAIRDATRCRKEQYVREAASRTAKEIAGRVGGPGEDANLKIEEQQRRSQVGVQAQ